MPLKRDVKTPPPVVIVRKKAAKGTAPSTSSQSAPQRSAAMSKATPSVTTPVQSVPQPIPPAQPQPVVPLSAAPAVTEAGPSKREREKQARRELLETMRDRWPLAFPRDYRQVRPLAIGISKDIAVHLPEQPLGRISNAIGIFQYLMGPAYFRAVLRGGPRYDLDGNARGEVTADEQDRAKRDLAAYHERRKQWMAEKRKAHEAGQAVGKHEESEGEPHD